MGRLPVVFFVEPTFGFDENLASEALTPGGYMLSAIARRGCREPADPTHIHSHRHVRVAGPDPLQRTPFPAWKRCTTRPFTSSRLLKKGARRELLTVIH
jgi:hypothetical protein